jgi:hypothetical protein
VLGADAFEGGIKWVYVPITMVGPCLVFQGEAADHHPRPAPTSKAHALGPGPPAQGLEVGIATDALGAHGVYPPPYKHVHPSCCQPVGPACLTVCCLCTASQQVLPSCREPPCVLPAFVTGAGVRTQELYGASSSLSMAHTVGPSQPVMEH